MLLLQTSMRQHTTVGICLLAVTLAIAAQDAKADSGSNGADASTQATLSRIRDAAMSSDWAYQHLADLTDKIGARLSGSPQLDAAVTQVADAMRALGAQVTLQPAKIPHWVRGEEQAQLVDYPGRLPGMIQPLHLTALGGSAATPAAGLTARVIVVHSFDELKARSVEIPGNIVLFASHFDQGMADNG